MAVPIMHDTKPMSSLAGRFDSLESFARQTNAMEGDFVGDTEVLSSNIEWNIACQLLWDISDFVENGMESDGSFWMLNAFSQQRGSSKSQPTPSSKHHCSR